MRIAVVVHGYPPVEAAGVELLAKEQADALAARGHEVSVFARALDLGRPDGSTWDEIVAGVRVRRVVNNCGDGRFRAFYDSEIFDEPFRLFLRERRPEIVHAQHLVLLSPRLVAVAQEESSAVVLGLHDAFYLCHRLFLLDQNGQRCPGPDGGARCGACLEELGGGAEGRDRFDAMARMLALADAVVAPSRALAERYVRELPFLEGKMEVIDPGLAYVPERGPRPGRLPDDRQPVRLVFIGTWLPHKGLDLLVDAVERLDPVRYELLVYGAGVQGREAYVQDLQARTRDLPVRWRGTFPAEALSEVLSEADALVLPSRCDESYSRVMREARAAGLAVIAPDTGGPAEVLRHEQNALLVPPDSLDALSKALARLVNDRSLLARLAAAPASWPSVGDGIARLEELYERILAERGNGKGTTAKAFRHSGPAAGARRSPRATILIPSYNHGPFVVEAVESALAQSATDIEVLVIDDGSSDDSVERLAALSDSRLTIVRQPNVGLSRTLNRGLARARGRWIKFLPSDDVLLPQCIERQLAAAEATPNARVVFSLPEVIDTDGAPYPDPAPQAWFDTDTRSRDAILRGLLERNFLCAPGALFDRDLALRVGGFDASLVVAQDYDLWLKILARADVAFLAERLVRIRWHGANQSAAATPATEAERAHVVMQTLQSLGLDSWVGLFRRENNSEPVEDAQARLDLAAALMRSGLREVWPVARQLVAEAIAGGLSLPESTDLAQLLAVAPELRRR